MEDKNAARQIAAIFGRSCREPSNDPGLDPALDSAAEVIARIRAEARAEALEEAAEAISMMNQMSPTAIDDDYLVGYGSGVRECQVKLETILADEPKEERGAEVDDIVTWTNSHGARMIGIFGREITQGDAIVLMRRAEVEHRVEGEK